MPDVDAFALLFFHTKTFVSIRGSSPAGIAGFGGRGGLSPEGGACWRDRLVARGGGGGGSEVGLGGGGVFRAPPAVEALDGALADGRGGDGFGPRQGGLRIAAELIESGKCGVSDDSPFSKRSTALGWKR